MRAVHLFTILQVVKSDLMTLAEQFLYLTIFATWQPREVTLEVAENITYEKNCFRGIMQMTDSITLVGEM
jgi:hypothetical protein